MVMTVARRIHLAPLQARADAPLVALAFDCQIFDEIPVAAHDVFMDAVLTETRALAGQGRKG